MRGARLAERSIGVSSSPDTKTRFVWVGAERKAYANKTLYLVIESGGQTTGTNVPGEIDVTFPRSEVGEIEWCSYIGKDMDIKKCTPSRSLKPGGEIKIK